MKPRQAITIVVFMDLVACEKNPAETKSGHLVLTGISSAKGSEIVTIDLDSGYVDTHPVNCHILSSTIYDPNTGEINKTVKLDNTLNDIKVLRRQKHRKNTMKISGKIQDANGLEPTLELIVFASGK
jgi:hypothetical protein